MDDAGIGAVAISDAAISGSIAAAAVPPEPEPEPPPDFYTYPIGRNLSSDYGKRKRTHRYVIGRR